MNTDTLTYYSEDNRTRITTGNGSSAVTVTRGWCTPIAYFYAMGVVIPSGFVCNIFCIVVFSMSAGLRRTTTGHYLTALASADTLFLVGDFIRWMNIQGCDGYFVPTDFMHQSEIACRLNYWLRYGAKLVSAWVTVTIATERLITVAFPLKVSSMSTSKRAKIIIIVLFVVGFTLGSYPLWTVGLNYYKSVNSTKCVIKDRNPYDQWSMVVLRVGTLGLPGLLITVITIITVVILIKASRRRMAQMEGQQSLTKVVRKNVSVSIRSSSPPERQLTATLLAVCIAFICLRLPYTIVYYLFEMQKQKTYEMFVANKVTDVVATSNYVVNLFLYSLCGSYFRQQALIVLGCRRIRKLHLHHPRGMPMGKDASEYSYKSRSSTVTRTSIM